ncbi:MazG-like nucleotide pyrophosphohydrolase [Arthrobacter phage Atuin]|nr:MazG-like nucleotide pyrophosphohydrolase [Arthrobacter phage Atuin]
MSFAQVQEFNDTFGVTTRVTRSAPEDLSPAVRVRDAKLRFELIKEEFDELLEAFEGCDIVELADALGDIRYVVVGAAQVFGITHTVSANYKASEEGYENQLLNEDVQKEILQLFRLAVLRNDIDGTATVLATMLKLVDDAAAWFEIELDDIVSAIHESNMSKLEDGRVIRHETTGKVLKGKNYKEPTADIEKLLGFEDVESE